MDNGRIISFGVMVVCGTVASLSCGDTSGCSLWRRAPSPWSESFGNHRARVRVEQNADAVWVRIPWRRRDAAQGRKDIVIIDAATNKRVENMVRVNVNREFGDLLFNRSPRRPVSYLLSALQDRGLVGVSEDGVSRADQSRRCGLGEAVRVAREADRRRPD